eukprot:TRINITY_DN28923_c0_g1_i1.p1 TRINITY_DN28923_c0_g1~~TRINITY_DN28923_c0_g1_i1.p1  ORF type:complete len:635 (-),score=96.36 TRINITY_DN28923_c0_g1_i1:71-1909(-)
MAFTPLTATTWNTCSYGADDSVREGLPRFVSEVLQNELRIFGDRIEGVVRNQLASYLVSRAPECRKSNGLESSPTRVHVFGDILGERQTLDLRALAVQESRSPRHSDVSPVSNDTWSLRGRKSYLRPRKKDRMVIEDRLMVENESDDEDDDEDQGIRQSSGNVVWMASRRKSARASTETSRMVKRTSSSRLSSRGRKQSMASDHDEESTDGNLAWVDSTAFAYCSAAFIFANSLTIGYQTDYMARHWSENPPSFCVVIEGIFCFVFAIEIMLRVAHHGLSFFSDNPATNLFDLLIVVFQIVEFIMEVGFKTSVSTRSGLVGSFTLLRTMKIVRLLRLASLIHLVKELRMLVVSIATSLRSMWWSFGLLASGIFVVGVYFTNLVTIFKLRNPQSRAAVETLEMLYGNVPRSMLTLFAAIASGISWEEVLTPLATHVSPYLSLFFCGYIAFTLFVVLNIITGIFVGTSLERAREDTQQVLMCQLQQFFRAADTKRTGEMTLQKFAASVEDENLQVYLKSIDLHEEEATSLFRLLDTDDSGTIDEEEFVSGCLRLHGQAKAIDMAAFMHDYRQWCKLINEDLTTIKTGIAEQNFGWSRQTSEQPRSEPKWNWIGI